MKSLFILATLVLSHLFTDHAVLQQQTLAPVWGWGDPGKTVTVSGSWSKETVKTTVGADGAWRVSLPTGVAGTGYTLTVKSGKETLTVRDIALGEVWICSGQSNMEMPVRGFGFQETEGALAAILEAPETASRVRVFDIKTPRRDQPETDVDARWAYSYGDVTAATSAIGYFFARRLTRSLDVPVGIIVNAWGGSRIEPWMPWEAIDASGISAQDRADIEAVEDQSWPTVPEVIWNGRVAPIVGYAAKGIIWYQGCSNIGQRCYDKLQAAMVRYWREQWGRDLPFIFALLAPYSHGDSRGTWRPEFVATQLNTENLLSNAWAVSTETLGDEITIHPPKKQEVADMMLQRALQNVYGIPVGIDIELPRPVQTEFQEDGSVKLRLSHVWSNLMSMRARSIRGFELAGEDRVFHAAEAQVDWDGNTILVRCAEVSAPVAVRYGWRNYMDANLQTSYGIPVPPFRSDNW